MRKKCLKQLLHSVQAKYIHHTKKPKQIYCEGEREVNKQKNNLQFIISPFYKMKNLHLLI